MAAAGSLDLGGRVYYAVDEMTAFGDRSPAQKRAVRVEEEAMLRHVDVAVGVSRRLTDRFATVHSRSRFLPNGADVDHFSPASLASAAIHEGIPRPFVPSTRGPISISPCSPVRRRWRDVSSTRVPTVPSMV